DAVRRALERDRERRFPTARAFAEALEAGPTMATPRAIGEWVRSLAGTVLAQRDAQVELIEDTTGALLSDVPQPRAAPTREAPTPRPPSPPSVSESSPDAPDEPTAGAGGEGAIAVAPGPAPARLGWKALAAAGAGAVLACLVLALSLSRASPPRTETPS